MTSLIKVGIRKTPTAFVPEAPHDGQPYVRLNGQWVPIVKGITHDFRVRAVATTMNTAILSGSVLSFDTVDLDSDLFAPVTRPFNAITIPKNLEAIYVFSGWSSSTGTQATSLGMGVLINGVNKFSDTNQTLWGPNSISYQLDAGAGEVLRLKAGDKLQLVSNSPHTAGFKSVVMAAARPRSKPGMLIPAMPWVQPA